MQRAHFVTDDDELPPDGIEGISWKGHLAILPGKPERMQSVKGYELEQDHQTKLRLLSWWKNQRNIKRNPPYPHLKKN